MADVELQTVEIKLEDHERRITSMENDVKCIQQDCAQEKIDFAGLKAKVETSLANHDSTMQLLKWVVIIAVTVIAGLAGVKIVWPG